MKALRTWGGDESGQMAGIEVVPFGLLVFVVGALLVANAWGVVDAKLAAEAAAREAARAYVEAAGPATADTDAATAGTEALAGHGRAPAKLDLARVEGSFARCQRVTFEARYPVPMVVVPWIGGLGEGFTVRARHSELVDPYRAGLAGRANCAG